MSSKRTIRALSEGGKVYVYLASEKIGRIFFRQAEAEGFLFGDGIKPTGKHYSDIIAVHPDGTLHYVGTYGRMAFHSGDKTVRKIDFEKYIRNETHYVL